MQARYYDPVIGRFYSNDPIGFRDIHSFNRYAYANNNPYKYTDPDGETPRRIGVTGSTTPYMRKQFVAAVNDILDTVFDTNFSKSRADVSEKHHVVPHGDKRAQGARDNMEANGIKPKTEKTNLVDIPGDKHDVTKRESYVTKTNDRIEAQPDEQSIKAECCKIAQELKDTPVEKLREIYPKK